MAKRLRIPARTARFARRRLYLQRRTRNSAFESPKSGDAAFDEYVSDPAKPVPYRARPIQPMGYSAGMTWSEWLVDDQREQSGRGDVLVFESETLRAPLKISGQPIANLVASTSGTDSDWVVKVIDVYPDEVAGQPGHGWISVNGFRGHFPGKISRKSGDAESDRSRASLCCTALLCRTPITCFCRGIG